MFQEVRAVLTRILPLKAGVKRKIVIIVLFVTLLLLLLKQEGGTNGRSYPQGSRHSRLGDIQGPLVHHPVENPNLDLEKLQNQLLLTDAELNAKEVRELGNKREDDTWIKVNEDHLPGPQESKIVDVESFERPLAVTLDTGVMTDDGVKFLEGLKSGSSRPGDGDTITILTINFKVGPLFDLRFSLEAMGVNFIEYSFSPHCHILGTCAEGRLDVITEENIVTLSSELIAKFHKRYLEDEIFQGVDAFLCVYPSALCELFMPFNKTIIMFLESRYDIGKLDPQQWNTWNENLMTLKDSHQKHFIRASNAYESEYVRFFVNFAPHVVAPACGYVKHAYNPTKEQYLLMPIRQANFEEQFLKDFHEAVRDLGANATLVPVSHHYPNHKPSDLVQHPGLILVPHQVSYLSLIEYYRMGIPIFVPAMELLARWHLRSNVVYDRMWNERRKWQKRHGLFKGIQPLPNPNDESTSDAIGFWLMFSDFYYQPNFIYYTSVADLARKLSAVGQNDLRVISQKMRTFSEQAFRKSTREWSNVVDNLRKQKSSREL